MTVQQLINIKKPLKIVIWITSILGIAISAFSAFSAFLMWELYNIDDEILDLSFRIGIYMFIVPKIIRSILNIYLNLKISKDRKNGKTDLETTPVIFDYIMILFRLFILFAFTVLSISDFDI